MGYEIKLCKKFRVIAAYFNRQSSQLLLKVHLHLGMQSKLIY